MKQKLFVFLIGAVVGAFAARLALSSSLPDDDAAQPVVGVGARSEGTPAPMSSAQLQLDPSDSDADLAQVLEQARFDKRWDAVLEVARVLRARKPQAHTAAAVSVQQPKARTESLVVLDHRYRRQAFLLELASHDNEATRVAAADEPLLERARRLAGLFLDPALEAGGQVVRQDAAYLLARLRVESGRRVLREALLDPDPERADLAAQALARADDPLATGILVEALAEAPQLELRRRAARALGHASEITRAGGVTRALVHAARNDRELSVRSRAIAALARTDLADNGDAQAALQQLLEDEAEDAVLRRASVAALRAQRAIARQLPEPLLETLELQLSETSGELRREIVETLGEGGRAESLRALNTALVAAGSADEQQALRAAITQLEGRVRER